MDDEELQGIVIDNGSSMLRAGFAGDDAPRSVIPNKLLTPSHTDAAYDNSLPPESLKNKNNNDNKKYLELGDDAEMRIMKSVLNHDERSSSSFPRFNVASPIEHGQIVNWDQMETMWNHAFLHELKMDVSETGVLMTEKPHSTKAGREKMTQIMFEKFDAAMFFVQVDLVLSLYASGRTTGLCIDSGYDSTHVCPVYEGYTLPHAYRKMHHLGGTLVDLFYSKLLLERGTLSLPGGHREMNALVSSMKEKTVLMPQCGDDFKAQLRGEFLPRLNTEDKREDTFTLPDNSIVKLNVRDRMLAAMPLFYPELLNASNPHERMLEIIDRQSDPNFVKKAPPKDIHAGPAQRFFDSAVSDANFGIGEEFDDKCFGIAEFAKLPVYLTDMEIRPDLCRNIVIAGGNTMIPGFADLLQLRLKKLFAWDAVRDKKASASLVPPQSPLGDRLRVVAPPERKYSVWIGGSILASLSTFQSMWVTKAEYDESGPNIVHRKCV